MCFLVFLVLLNLFHSEPNTIETEGYLSNYFLKINVSHIKIKFLISVVKYIFIKVELECQEKK